MAGEAVPFGEFWPGLDVGGALAEEFQRTLRRDHLADGPEFRFEERTQWIVRFGF